MNTTTTALLIADPELGEPRCPNGHNSAIPPQCPALMFIACHHYNTRVSWNEFCITCGVRPADRHRPFHGRTLAKCPTPRTGRRYVGEYKTKALCLPRPVQRVLRRPTRLPGNPLCVGRGAERQGTGRAMCAG